MKNSRKPATAVERNGNELDGGANRTSNEPAKAHVKVTAPSGTDARRASRQVSAAETSQLVCRYCGSDDLAPSFIKRRDARRRPCFKQRYGSAARNENKTQIRKAAMA